MDCKKLKFTSYVLSYDKKNPHKGTEYERTNPVTVYCGKYIIWHEQHACGQDVNAIAFIIGMNFYFCGVY